MAGTRNAIRHAAIGDAVKGMVQVGYGQEAAFLPFAGFVTSIQTADETRDGFEAGVAYAGVAIAGYSQLTWVPRSSVTVVRQLAMVAPFRAGKSAASHPQEPGTDG